MKIGLNPAGTADRHRSPRAYTVYYDASGDESSGGTVVVAGAIATEKKWERFNTMWREALSEFGVNYFHMRDFTSSRREFEGWSDHSERRTDLLSSLLAVIKRGINMWQFTIMPVSEFAAFDAEYTARERLKRVYCCCALRCTIDATEWALKHNCPEKWLVHVFEHGDEGVGEVCRVLREKDIEAQSRSKVDESHGGWIPAFQACDFLAWEMRRFYDDIKYRGRRGEQLRRSFREIHKSIPLEVREINSEWLTERAREWPQLIAKR